MKPQQQHSTVSQSTPQLRKLQKQMQALQNEMELVEILAQFWPLPNMSDKMSRMQYKLQELSRQQLYLTGLSANTAGSLPFQKKAS